jgi:hypothetical protein
MSFFETQKECDVEILPFYKESPKAPSWIISRERLIAAAEEDSPIDILKIHQFLKQREQTGNHSSLSLSLSLHFIYLYSFWFHFQC